ncbi:MAG: hypothetical protein KIS92_14990 [Planctomycetota bacterium]|nr:hypothetical protein [Planctomycetota bacterium]
MTEAEWSASRDPERLLAAVAGRASPEALRRLACAACARLLDKYPDDWGVQVFRAEGCAVGGYVSPEDWPAALLREAIRIADAAASATGRSEEMRAIHKAAGEAAERLHQRFQHANCRLGDAATGAEVEVGYVGWHGASAARDCCGEDIRASAAGCIGHVVEALGYRSYDAGKPPEAEKAAMADLIRRMIPFPGHSA